MITDEVYVEIEILRKHGMSLRKIAEAVGCAVNTVRSHLEADTLPRYKRSALRRMNHVRMNHIRRNARCPSTSSGEHYCALRSLHNVQAVVGID